ncbi:MAG: hypothetical protein OEV89_04155 [Desulfobulbaceae bacterium]|nr:hypothetical protein [Desulfobulbaceae bacterium]HIJ89938.1 hypothetical protein [Deltaproteobacteria bacterium]
MPLELHFITSLWAHLLWPLVKILFWVSVGLIAANFIEALNWTHRLASLTRPLVRLGRLSTVSGASFSMAFFSGVTANTMLAEAFDKGQLSKKELVLANLFNGLPRFFLHLPTVFFLTAPLIKMAALVYLALTFAAAMLQTVLVVIGGRILLPPLQGKQGEIGAPAREKTDWQHALDKSLKRFQKRIKGLIYFTVPVYILFYFLGKYGFFVWLENFFATQAWFLAWLKPQSLGIVMAHVTVEFSSGLAAAGALLADKSLSYKEVVLALLVGNILSTPIRAVRHQFPYYVGIFTPKLAVELVGVSQILRLASVIAVGLGYYLMPIG